MSTVSDDQYRAIRLPTFGSRRVSVFVALPVILGCAVLGSIVGVVHPLRSFFQDEHRGEEFPDLRLASLKLVETPSAEQQNAPAPSTVQATESPRATEKPLATEQPRQPEPAPVTAASVAYHAQSPPPSAVVSVSTGSVDRAPAPGPTEEATPAAAERADSLRADAPSRLTHSHRLARAKRVRRLVARRGRVKPPGSEVDAFFSSLFVKK